MPISASLQAVVDSIDNAIDEVEPQIEALPFLSSVKIELEAIKAIADSIRARVDAATPPPASA